MSKNGTYVVNDSPKGSAVGAFICALLFFLVLCLALYLLVALVKQSKETSVAEEYPRSEKSWKEFEASRTSNKRKKYESTTTPNIEKERRETTPRHEKDYSQTPDNKDNNIPYIDSKTTTRSDEKEEDYNKVLSSTEKTTTRADRSSIIRNVTRKQVTTEATRATTTEDSIFEEDPFPDTGIDHEIFHGSTKEPRTTEDTDSGKSTEAIETATRFGDELTTENDGEDASGRNVVMNTGESILDSSTSSTDRENAAETSTISQKQRQSGTSDFGTSTEATHHGYNRTTARTFGVTTEPTVIEDSSTISLIKNTGLQKNQTYLSSGTTESRYTSTSGGVFLLTTEASTQSLGQNLQSTTRTPAAVRATPQLVVESSTSDVTTFGSSTRRYLKLKASSTARSAHTTESSTSEALYDGATTESLFSTTAAMVVPTRFSRTKLGRKYKKYTSMTTEETQSSSTAAAAKLRTRMTTEPPTSPATSAPKIYASSRQGSLPAAPTSKDPEDCSSTICKTTASKMLVSMNHVTDPCEDFYEFACGGQESNEDYLEQVNREALLNYINNINASSEKYLWDFRNFYDSCVDYESNFDYSSRMELMRDFPDQNLTELVSELVLLQAMPMFDIGLDVAPTSRFSPPVYKFQLTFPGHSSLKTSIDGWSLLEQTRNYCLHKQKNFSDKPDVNLHDVYTSFKYCQTERLNNLVDNFMEEMMRYFTNSSVYTENNHSNLRLLVSLVTEILPETSEITEAQVNKTFHKGRISDLTFLSKNLDWKVMLESLTFNSTFSNSDGLDFYVPKFFAELTFVVNRFTESELIQLLQLYSKLQLYENLVVPKAVENRDNYCLQLSKQLMPDIVSTIVYDLANRDRDFNVRNMKIKSLFEELQSQFDKSLQEAMLDDSSKQSLQDKLSRIKLGLITTGDYNVTRANYKDLNITAGSYAGNVVTLLKNYRKTVYSLERRTASSASLLRYFVDHFETRPKSFYASEYIVFHPAVFQKTSMDLPEYIRLAKIGFHLSKELAKHFDPIGKYFMTDPTLLTSSFDYYSYVISQTKNLLDYFANNTYTFKEKVAGTTRERVLFFKNSGNLWINEMISDNAAFKLVFNTYAQLTDQEDLVWASQSYSSDKVFFIAAAQEFCKKTSAITFMEDVYETRRLPPPLRIQNFLSNSKEFSSTFDCVEGSAMKLNEEMIAQFPYIEFSVGEFDMNYN